MNGKWTIAFITAMMGIMTLTFIPIDLAALARAPSPNNYYGPFEYGGKIWSVNERIQGATSTWSGRVYASADSGATWQEQDAAHRPYYWSVGSVYYAGGATIYICYRSLEPGINRLLLTSFDMSTGLWGATIGGGPTGSLTDYGLVMVRRSNGSFVVAYGKSSGGAVRGFYAVYSAGWAAEVQFTPAGTDWYGVREILLDAEDLVHLFYTYGPLGGPTYMLGHCALTSGGVLSALQDIVSVGGNKFGVGFPCIWTGKLVIPYGSPQLGGHYYPAVAYGTPSGSSAPVWSVASVGSVYILDAHFGIDNNALFSFNNQGTLEVFAVSQSSDYSADGLIRLYRVTNPGTGFGAVETYYTESPWAGAGVLDFFHNPSVTRYASGSLGVLVDRLDATANSFTTYAYRNGGAQPPTPPQSPVNRDYCILVPPNPNSPTLDFKQEPTLESPTLNFTREPVERMGS